MSFRSLLVAGLVFCVVVTVFAQEPIKHVSPGNKPQTVEPPLANSEAIPPRNLPAMNLPDEPKTVREIIPTQAVRPLESRPVQNINGGDTLLITPVMTINVVGSETASEGAEVKYTLIVRNRSEAKAHHIIVRCPLPKNAEFIKATMEPKVEKVGESSELTWALNSMGPGESKSIEVIFKPNPGETEVKVLGRIQYDHGRGLSTKIAKPALSLRKTAAKEGILYDAIPYRIEVSNPGVIPVTDIKLEDALGKEEGMEYERDAKATIDYENQTRSWTISRLAPGEKKVFEFNVIAKKVGAKRTISRATGNGMPSVEEVHQINIVEAKLQMKVSPPNGASVGEPAKFQIVVQNNGTATLNNVRINCNHPTDVEVKGSTNGGQFFRENVQWVIPKLAAGENRTLNLAFVAKSAGKRKFNFACKADRGLEQKDDANLDFEGVASLNWKTDGDNVATVGKEFKYRVELWNPGTAMAKNVKVVCTVPPEARLVEANPPLYHDDKGVVSFHSISLPPKTKATFTITCLAQKKGVATFHFDLLADHLSKSGTQHNEVLTIINGDNKESVPVNLERTGKVPEPLKLKEAEVLTPRREPEPPKLREAEVLTPKKEPEPPKLQEADVLLPKKEEKVEPKLELKLEPKKEPQKKADPSNPEPLISPLKL